MQPKPTVRSIAAGALAALLGAASLALANPAGGESRAETGGVPLKLAVKGSPSQRAVLARAGLKVRIKARRAGLVRIAPMARAAGRRAPKRIGRARKLKLRRGSRLIKLPLSRAGRALVASCAGKTVIVKARYKARGGGPTVKAKGKRALVSDRAACAQPNATAPPPSGGAGGGAGPGGGNGGGGNGNHGGGNGGGGNGNVIPPPTPWDGAPIDVSNAGRCDFLDPSVCLHPFPNDRFTAADPGTDTGRRIDFDPRSMPSNAPLGLGLDAKPIDPTDFNRNDGFSPGNLIVTKVPGLETQQAFDNTGAVSIDHPERYDDPGQPVVVIDAETRERHPVWAEIDSNPADPADVNLIIRPLVNFEEGGRYVVALRNLRDDADQPIEPSDAFRAYRDNRTNTGGPGTPQPEVEARRPQMEELFEILGKAGIQRSSLYLTWDFTVASERNLSERMLTIRDDAFGQLGDFDLADGVVEGASPTVTDISSEDFTTDQDHEIAREVTGTIEVPCYLTAGCAPAGAQFNNAGDPDGIPTQNGITTFDFTCRIPRESRDGPIATGTRPSLYGHGLLGSAGEVSAGNVDAMALEQQLTFCATDWFGFATQNIANILAILQDLSFFPLLADGSQQGFLQFLFLGRALIHDGGLTTDDAFKAPDGPDPDSDPDPVLDTSHLYYDGNSQGGILGGGLTAVAPDFRRAVLGVPGMNYSTLLRRSVDFEPYAEGQFGAVIEDAICDQANQVPNPDLAALVVALCTGVVPDDTPLGLYDNYPNELERPLIFSLMQMLWDRAEANGYAHHMTSDPLANTPPHRVLLHAAFGDHQVANVTAEVEARTIGASVYQPALDPGRHWQQPGAGPLFGIPAIPSFPFGGSALVYWDGGPLGFPGGSATPPNGNVPPRPPDYGADPHGYPRSDVKARAQKGAFLSAAGQVRNPCTTTNNVASPTLPIGFETGAPTPCYSHGYLGP